MKEILKVLREEFNLPKQASLCFTDIRSFSQIPLWHIIIQIIMCPFFGIKSFLTLDTESRAKWYKKIFKSRRKMVSSDTSVQRILNWLSIKQSRKFLLQFLSVFEEKKSLEKKLIKRGKSHRIGIIDGSFMGGHWVAVLTLSGMINLPILIENYKNRGKELRGAHRLLSAVPRLLEYSAPTLYLLDSLYFNTEMFKKIVGYLNASLVIKSRNPGFRDVLKDASLFFGKAAGEYRKLSGYDGERMCRWEIYLTEDEFAGFPIQIIQVNEYYPKRKKDSHVQFFAVCTDMQMDAEEIREAAHYRWQIENNVFKRLNEHCGTKNERTKSQNVFLNMLHLQCLGLAMFDLFIFLLKDKKKCWDKFRMGRKATWKNIQSIFWEKLFNRIVFIA